MTPEERLEAEGNRAMRHVNLSTTPATITIKGQVIPPWLWDKETREWVARMRAASKLAENQFWADSFSAEARWHNGKPEARTIGRENWEDWRLGLCGDFNKAGDAWFRANCPPDRFVTDEGEVLRFEMTEDGEADISGSESKKTKTSAAFSPSDDWMQEYPERLALYRFRDQERAKWMFRRFEKRRPTSYVGVSFEGVSAGIFDERGATETTPWPTWVRNKAEALYREKNPELDVRWYPNTLDGGAVDVFSDGNFCGRLTRNGFEPPSGNPNQPTHILTQARAKFRENYRLERDELWFQGMPVKMVFDLAGDCVRAQGTEVAWREENGLGMGLLDFLDRDENTEAITRMRLYYYEEHPGKCLHHQEGDPLEFRMNGTYGVAAHTTGEKRAAYVTGRPCVDWTEHEQRNREKLRAWTEERLKKLEPKVSHKVVVDFSKGTGVAVGDSQVEVSISCTEVEAQKAWSALPGCLPSPFPAGKYEISIKQKDPGSRR